MDQEDINVEDLILNIEDTDTKSFVLPSGNEEKVKLFMD